MRRAALALLPVALVAGCTVGVRRARPTPSPTPSASAASVAPPSACPTGYAKPDPKRPRITLTFDLDGRVVTGTEHVVFTPDLPVSELVFRGIANAGDSADGGGRLEVTSASLPMTVEQAGAPEGTPGSLIRLALPAPVAPGTEVTADLTFKLTLPLEDFDRLGFDTDLAWWGSGHPLLAWQRGVGWATEPVVGIVGETASSEAASYDVTVTAPSRLTVVGNGAMDPPATLSGGRKRWHFRNDRARDVAVAAGLFTTTRATVEGVPLTIAVEDALDATAVAAQVTTFTQRSLKDFRARFGPYPFDSLTVVALEAVAGGGVEYPGLFFVGSRRYALVTAHELAHEWFYGLVGNNQAVEPWLDEAFATYAEALHNRSEADYLDALGAKGDVATPMTYWDTHQKAYGTVVYAKGGAALLTARTKAGPGEFDVAIRCYVARNAWRIATGDDLEAAVAHLPAALAVLRGSGAI